MIKNTKHFMMDQDYDYQSDSLLLHITEDYEYKKSVRLEEDIILDFDKNDVPVALELLNASKTLHVKKSSLIQPVSLKMNIGVAEDTIKLDATLSFLIHQKQIPKSLNWQTSNDVNLTANEASFATA
ncbi:MAG: DUF2283 domain-containing protein [Methanobacteriaceae archaeon]|nr:DUF2283 domain-containing protein [Methanobacteriaceae archaeon]MDO9626008.1 DUF2283 domain-containing protein [Methanobacteriaceae archaeon]